jgi:hypothetical protein
VAYGYQGGPKSLPASFAPCGFRVQGISILNDQLILVVIKNIWLEKLDKTSTVPWSQRINVLKESSKSIQDLRVFGNQWFAATMIRGWTLKTNCSIYRQLPLMPRPKHRERARFFFGNKAVAGRAWAIRGFRQD